MQQRFQTIGIHPSVDELFPPSVLQDHLDDVAATVEIVDNSESVHGYDGLITFDYDEAFLSADLSWIHCVLAGVDHFPLERLKKREIRLTNSTGIHGDAIGETVLGYMLQFARRLHRHRDNEAQRTWRYPSWDEAFTLSGETICIVGLGTLGRGVAARADAIGMDTVGVRRTPTPVEHVDQLYTPDSICEAVTDARFVVLTVPLTPQTEDLVGPDELAAMRDDAYLVNVARGPVVDQAALVDELTSDGLAGAALDVFEIEPLPTDSPLWEMDNVIVTPHAAAANRAYSERVATLIRENVRRIRADESLANQVI